MTSKKDLEEITFDNDAAIRIYNSLWPQYEGVPKTSEEVTIANYLHAEISTLNDSLRLFLSPFYTDFIGKTLKIPKGTTIYLRNRGIFDGTKIICLERMILPKK